MDIRRLMQRIAIRYARNRHNGTIARERPAACSSDDKLLAVSHTYQQLEGAAPEARIISAREATRHERQQYENEPR